MMTMILKLTIYLFSNINKQFLNLVGGVWADSAHDMVIGEVNEQLPSFGGSKGKTAKERR